jgi:transposase
MDNSGEVCLEEEVEKLRRLGMSAPEISRRMGVELSWVETLVSMSEAGHSAEDSPPDNRQTKGPAG